MFHLIPRPLHIAALRTAHSIRVLWWHMTSGVVTGCRVLVIDPDGRVLLIRHSYGSRRWMMPGGGVKRGEDVLVAAQREVREEVALTLVPLFDVDFSDEPLGGGRNHIHLVAGFVTHQRLANGRLVGNFIVFRVNFIKTNNNKFTFFEFMIKLFSMININSFINR